MANSGYISSSGINQVFTTGPYSGSIVTSSYSSGSTLLGPTVTFYQAFISGSGDDTSSATVNTIFPCSNSNNEIFQRYRYDPINCPTGDCLPPIIISAAVRRCLIATDYRYYLFFDSGSTNAVYSTIQYSTVSDFSFNTGSYAVTNSLNNYTSSIDVSNLSLLPTKTNPVYFRIFNSCSLGGTSSYSPVASASCQTTPPPTTTSFNVRLKNSMTGSNNTLYYISNRSEFSLFGGTTVNLVISTLGSLTIPFRTLKPDGTVNTIILSGSSPTFNGSVTTQLNDNTLTPASASVYQSVNNYTSSIYYNSEGTPDASIVIDRTLWSGAGLLQLDFTDQVPSNILNPWYEIPLLDEGIGGGPSY
jgi:hypothetical protein